MKFIAEDNQEDKKKIRPEAAKRAPAFHTAAAISGKS